ncbi:MAG TPA: DUF2303 family protein [Noviherbaspirillum sp.]|nr:DUF2303 family protein [Noviherbaspirillum sp.]
MDNQNAQAVRDMGAALADVRCVNDSASPFVIVPAGFVVHDLEKTLELPIRKTGAVTMNDAASFIDYFKLHQMASRIYGQVEPPKFIAVMNDHRKDEPGWRDHKLVYNCPVSKEWKEWKGFAGAPRDQIAFSEFIESHTTDIISNTADEPSGAVMLEVATSFKAQKKVNFASGQRLDNGQVDFVFQEEIQGSAGPKGHIKVPERFYIGIPVFEGGAPYRIECKLRYRLKDGALSMWFDMVRDHKVQEAAFMDIWKEIADATQTTIWRGVPA